VLKPHGYRPAAILLTSTLLVSGLLAPPAAAGDAAGTCTANARAVCDETKSAGPPPAAVDAQDLSALRSLGLLPDDAAPQPPPDPPAETPPETPVPAE
jgi:hypothetical protein